MDLIPEEALDYTYEMYCNVLEEDIGELYDGFDVD